MVAECFLFYKGGRWIRQGGGVNVLERMSYIIFDSKLIDSIIILEYSLHCLIKTALSLHFIFM